MYNQGGLRCTSAGGGVVPAGVASTISFDTAAILEPGDNIYPFATIGIPSGKKIYGVIVLDTTGTNIPIGDFSQVADTLTIVGYEQSLSNITLRITYAE